MRVRLLVVVSGVLVLSGGAAAAQERSCSANGGYPEGSPAAVLAGIRNLSSGTYAQCVEQRRQQQPQARLTLAQSLFTARSAVLRLLAEPNAATFRNVQAMTGADGITTYCGEVGGPNASGATTYRLFQAAVAPGGRPTAWLDSSDPTASAYFRARWNISCNAPGHAVTF